MDSYFSLLNLSFVENCHISIFTTFAKQSMINRLSNSINHNRSAAKISKVMSSSRQPPTFHGSILNCIARLFWPDCNVRKVSSMCVSWVKLFTGWVSQLFTCDLGDRPIEQQPSVTLLVWVTYFGFWSGWTLAPSSASHSVSHHLWICFTKAGSLSDSYNCTLEIQIQIQIIQIKIPIRTQKQIQIKTQIKTKYW